MVKNSELIKGGIIGWVAALLGVGGSVMTVPLLRRGGQFYGRGCGYCKHSHAAFVFNCNADLLRIVTLAIYTQRIYRSHLV